MNRIVLVVDDFPMNVDLTLQTLRSICPTEAYPHITYEGFTSPEKAIQFVHRVDTRSQVFLITDGNMNTNIDGSKLVNTLREALANRFRLAIIATHGYEPVVETTQCVDVLVLQGKAFQTQFRSVVEERLRTFLRALPFG